MNINKNLIILCVVGATLKKLNNIVADKSLEMHYDMLKSINNN